MSEEEEKHFERKAKVAAIDCGAASLLSSAVRNEVNRRVKSMAITILPTPARCVHAEETRGGRPVPPSTSSSTPGATTAALKRLERWWDGGGVSRRASLPGWTPEWEF